MLCYVMLCYVMTPAACLEIGNKGCLYSIYF